MAKRAHSGLTDQRKAALKRKLDAWKLLSCRGDEHTRGAIYLGGYAIECKLKAIAMERHNCWTLEELAQAWDVSEDLVFSHGLEVFLKRLGLYDKLRQSTCSRDFTDRVNQWRPSWRYSPRNWPKIKATAFMEAVNHVYDWLEATRC